MTVVEAARIPWRPLGRLLVSKGLVSDDQLEAALQDQGVSGRRLGEILVELGFVSQRALSLALAEQYGIDPPAETGFGTGLLAAIDLRQGRASDQTSAGRPPASGAAPALALVPEASTPDAEHGHAPDPLPFTNDFPLANLEEHWARLAEAEERLAETEREIADLRRANEHRRGQVERLIERLRQRELRNAELASAFERESARTATPPPPEPRPLEQRHLVLAQLADRYELVERDGPPPLQNATLELPEISDANFVIVGVGRALLPTDTRRCVLALPIPEAPEGGSSRWLNRMGSCEPAENGLQIKASLSNWPTPDHETRSYGAQLGRERRD